MARLCTGRCNDDLNLFGSNSPPLGAYTFAVVFGFDTPLLAAGLFIHRDGRDVQPTDPSRRVRLQEIFSANRNRRSGPAQQPVQIAVALRLRDLPLIRYVVELQMTYLHPIAITVVRLLRQLLHGRTSFRRCG